MSDFFNKHIKKTTARTKEKLLEGLGRNKATQDEAFDFHATNLQKQSKACEKLHKDLKAYATILKELGKTEKALRESIRECYEEQWPNRENLCAITQTIDCNTDDFEKVINEDLLGSVGHYVTQFAELKKKVEKRGRKLVDYDHARNTYNSLRESSKKGDSDPKVAKAFTEFQQAEAMYKEINTELLEVLPATYDSRITFIVDNLQNLFNSQSQHQTECAKLNKQLVTQLDQLGQSMDSLRVVRPECRSTTPVRGDSPAAESPIPDGGSSPSASIAESEKRRSVASGVVPNKEAVPAPSSDEKKDENTAEQNGHADVEEEISNKVYPKLNSAPPAANSAAAASVAAPTAAGRSEKGEKPKKEKDPNNPFDDTDDEEAGESEITKEERKVLYEVKSTHKYTAVDPDELNFAPNTLIKVLESKDSDQLDAGWLLGELEDGKRGVFPENFTKKV